jgi:hypothetical protein
MRPPARRGHRGLRPGGKSEKKTSDCGFEKRKKLCELGIERAEERIRNAEKGIAHIEEFGKRTRRRPIGRNYGAARMQKSEKGKAHGAR